LSEDNFRGEISRSEERGARSENSNIKDSKRTGKDISHSTLLPPHKKAFLPPHSTLLEKKYVIHKWIKK
jgi:hypothetical protein